MQPDLEGSFLLVIDFERITKMVESKKADIFKLNCPSLPAHHTKYHTNYKDEALKAWVLSPGAGSLYLVLSERT